jgi:hypothetical protein
MPIKITREDTKDYKVAVIEPIEQNEPTVYDLAYLYIEVRWIREFNLNELELLVFGFINSYRPSTGKIYFSNAQLGKMFNKSEITISRTICSLRDKRMIDVEIQNTMGGAIRYIRPSDEFLDKSRYSKMTRPLVKNDKTPSQKRLGNSNINNDINNISKDISKPKLEQNNFSLKEKKPTYGNTDINVCLDYLKEKLGASLDGTEKENRQYCYNLLRKLKKDYPDINAVDSMRLLIDTAYQDKFHSTQATGFKYLFYNTQKIAQSFKRDYGIGNNNSDIQVI